MKKLTSLFVILALLMLCACGSKTGATADGAAAPDSSAFLPSPRIRRETPSSGSAASCVQPSSCAEKSPYRQSGPCAAFGK